MKIDRKLFEAALQIVKKGISKKADITSKTLVEIKNSGISLVGMNDGICHQIVSFLKKLRKRSF